MGERTSYEPGVFCWVDLATTDQDAAKVFYAELFGWEYDDRPVDEGVVYSVATLGERAVAAVSPMPQRMRDAGAPPNWMSCVSVADANAAAARARELGAELYAEPFDVMDAGRMAVVSDPQGAVFSVWEPRENHGAQLVNVPGAFTWNDVVTTDPEAARRFYGELFGWTFEVIDGADPPYAVIQHGGRSNGGVMGAPPGQPPTWAVYFATDDLDGSIARAEGAGAQKVFGPMRVPTGSFAVMRDPQGAHFNLSAGEFDD
jgi:uncharacterized protein